MRKHPIQPIERDSHGIIRFKENAIVRYLLDNGGISLNDIARMDFSNDDQQQFAQLIGYSVSGYGDLGYVDHDAIAIADMMSGGGVTSEQARIAHLEEELAAIRSALREPMSRLFGVHPDDLGRA